MKQSMRNKMRPIIILSLCIFFTEASCGLYSNRSIPFNKKLWNSWDVTFDESRYNMAIWFFKENWFSGKNQEIIMNELFQNKKINHIEHFYYNNNSDENILLYDLKYSNEFMERWNIDFDFKPIAYLKIYFDKNNQILRAELLEGNRRMDVKEYKIRKYWKIK
jgi:hypothetical protein